MNPTTNPEVAVEVAEFDAEELAACESYYEAYLEAEFEPGLASRNAVAMIMQKKRMTKPGPTPKQYREMLFWYNTIRQTRSDEEADRSAWDRVMKPKKQ